MKKDRLRTKSRRITPWIGIHDAAPMQAFIEECTRIEYESKHPTLKGSPEVALINSFVPKACPHCGSDGYRKKGFTSNGVQRFVCHSCGRSFCALTGTVWIDEKFYTVRAPDIRRRPDGTLYNGISRNQMCIGVGCDDKGRILCIPEGLEKLLTLAIRNPRLLRYRG